jgi:hypothetical protein
MEREWWTEDEIIEAIGEAALPRDLKDFTRFQEVGLRALRFVGAIQPMMLMRDVLSKEKAFDKIYDALVKEGFLPKETVPRR